MQQLKEAVAWVTGAARGIGAATALRLATAGARVCASDVDEQGARATVAAIASAGGEGLALYCDVTKRDQVESAAKAIDERFGRLDILVNNAGIIRDNLLFRMSDDDWTDVLDVHLKGAFFCAREAQKRMVAQRYGKIVSLSSASAAGRKGQANYAAAKAGIQGLTRTLALELGKFNINVNAVAPGFIDTEMTRVSAQRMGYDPHDYMRIRAESIALGRVGRPEDVANVICFLCSDESSFISGQTISVGGGPGPFN